MTNLIKYLGIWTIFGPKKVQISSDRLVDVSKRILYNKLIESNLIEVSTQSNLMHLSLDKILLHDECTLNIFLDTSREYVRVYVSITNNVFTSRYSTFSLMSLFKSEIDKLIDKNILYDTILNKFGTDRVTLLSNKLDDLKNEMENSVLLAVDNLDDLNELEKESEILEQEANIFENSAHHVDDEQKRKLCTTNLVIISIIVILIIILLSSVLSVIYLK
jgi:hypothetical protein